VLEPAARTAGLPESGTAGVPLSGTVLPAAALAATGESWPVIVERWIASQLADATKAGYRREADLFADWCQDCGLDPRGVRRHDVEAYRNARTAAGDSARTVSRRLSAISSLFTYGGSLGLPANPVTGVKRPKYDRTSSPSQSLARGEVPRLLAAAEADGPRSDALARLFVEAGLRVSEAVGADVEDLGWDKGHRVLTITGKGGAEVKVPLPPSTARAVDRAAGERSTGPILATSTGGRMDRRHAHRTIRRLARDAGVNDWEHIGPHDIRHTAITGVLDATGNIDKAQRFARHASPVTTQVYDHRNKKLDDHPSYALAAWFSEAS